VLDRGKLRPLAQVASPLAWLLDGVTGLLLKAPPAGEPNSRVEPLTPAGILEHLPTVTKSLRLVPDYDLPYLDWLFGELDAVAQRGPPWAGAMRRGPLWAELVSRADEPRGWYVCHLRPGGFCRLLQFAARSDEAEFVYDQLVARARQQGAAGLYGRVEPSILEAISSHRTLIHTHTGRLLVHARNDEIIRAIQSGQALLTRMDGEWW
jgi:hypothetical protein